MLYQLTYVPIGWERDDGRYPTDLVDAPPLRNGNVSARTAGRMLDLGIQTMNGRPFRLEIARYAPLSMYPDKGCPYAVSIMVDQLSWYPAPLPSPTTREVSA